MEPVPSTKEAQSYVSWAHARGMKVMARVGGVKLIDEARAGSPDVDALELVLGSSHPLDKLGNLALRFAQVLQHFGAEILVELDDLQLGFADLGARARNVGDELTAFAAEPRLLALQLHETGNADKIFLVELGNANQFIADKRNLLFLGLGLRSETANFLVALGDPLAQL